MRLRKKRLQESRLYVLIDKDTLKQPVLKIAAKLAKSGVGIIQLRDKSSPRTEVLRQAFLLSGALKNSSTLFIVNDYPDIARISGSDGLHIGQTDLGLKSARKIIGRDKIIGVTCLNLRQALKAQNDGADYIAVGPAFKTKIKPKITPVGLEVIAKIRKKIKIPVFAIGGINPTNLAQVISCGLDRIAVCQAVLKSRNIALAAKKISEKLVSK